MADVDLQQFQLRDWWMRIVQFQFQFLNRIQLIGVEFIGYYHN